MAKVPRFICKGASGSLMGGNQQLAIGDLMKASILIRCSLCATSALVIAFLDHTAIAQGYYPAKPVTLVVSFTPASRNDVIA